MDKGSLIEKSECLRISVAFLTFGNAHFDSPLNLAFRKELFIKKSVDKISARSSAFKSPWQLAALKEDILRLHV